MEKGFRGTSSSPKLASTPCLAGLASQVYYYLSVTLEKLLGQRAQLTEKPKPDGGLEFQWKDFDSSVDDTAEVNRQLARYVVNAAGVPRPACLGLRDGQGQFRWLEHSGDCHVNPH